MKITTEHSASSYGIPVILDSENQPMDYSSGLAAVRKQLGLSTSALGEMVGVSRRTIENWEQGRNMPPANVLFVLAGMLKTTVANR